MALEVPCQHVKKYNFFISISSLFAPRGIKTRSCFPRVENFPNDYENSSGREVGVVQSLFSKT